MNASASQFKKPASRDYTIYSISNCKYCVMAKEHLGSISGVGASSVINCDKFVGSCRERDNFYNFMRQYTVIPYIHFPMIFKDGKFIGGLKELLERQAKPAKATQAKPTKPTKQAKATPKSPKQAKPTTQAKPTKPKKRI
jgi:glutaredoxin